MHWLLIGYMWLYIHRPFEIWPALGNLYFERVYMFVALAAWLASPRKRWLPNPLHAAYVVFAAVVALACMNSPYSEVGYPVLEDYAKVLVFYLLLVTVVTDEKSLQRFVLAYLVIMGLYLGHSFFEYVQGRHVFRMGIIRMIGMGVSMADPNTFAAGILYSLPLVVPLWIFRPTLLVRGFLTGYVALACLCLVLSGSRAALVGLLAFVFLSIVTSGRRAGLRLALVMLPLLPLSWFVLPGSLQNRFLTLVNPEAGPVSAMESAGGRMFGFNRGLDLWARSPVTGCGPAAFGLAVGTGKQSHNLYGQITGELGTLGVVAFLLLLGGFVYNAVTVRRLYREHRLPPDFSYHLVKAISITVLLLLLMGWGGHNLYRYNWIWYGAFEVIAVFLARARATTAWEEELEKGLSPYDECDPEAAPHPDGPPLAGRWDTNPYPV